MIASLLLFPWIYGCARCVNPPLTWPTRSIDARGRRLVVAVGGRIAKPNSVLVQPSHRLLKQPRLRIALRHGSFADVELVFVHEESDEGARLIGVVGELHCTPFDEVHGGPCKQRHLG